MKKHPDPRLVIDEPDIHDALPLPPRPGIKRPGVCLQCQVIHGNVASQQVCVDRRDQL